LSDDMLFTDGLPVEDSNSGYRGANAAAAAGISYRQLDYWARTGLVSQPFKTPKAQVPKDFIHSATSWF